MKKSIYYMLAFAVIVLLVVTLMRSLENGEVVAPEDTNIDEPVVNEPIVDEQVEEFSRVGNLTRNNPGMTEDVWVLVYEGPGSPALTAELQFDGMSQCEVDGEVVVCDESLLVPGQRVEVNGEIQDEVVLVRNLVVISSPSDDIQ
jgi:hypothetical protein